MSRRMLIGCLLMVLALLAPTVPAAAATHTTVVTLTFDDADADQVIAEQAMTAAGLHGTFYVVSGWVGAPGYLTRANLNTFAGDGHEIGGHTVTHPDLIQIAPAEAQRQICNDRFTLDSWGFRPVSFAYPFSDANPTVEATAKQCGYTTARGLGDVRSAFGCTGCVRAETAPPPDPAYLRAPDQVDSRWTLANLTNQVTSAVNSSGGWVILTFHHLCTAIGAADCQADQSITPTVFKQFTTWLAGYAANPANRTSVKTVDQQVRSYLGANYPAYVPPTQVPTGPPPTPGVNLISNPSLETANTFTGFPDCFQPGGWGTNTAAWSTTTGAHSGSVAEQLTVTGYNSGDAKLLPTLDLGTCSPSVTPGRSYRLSTWYQSTGVAQFALYYRDASGAWYYWTSSPWFAASTTWQQASFVTPAVPANAVGMTFGLALISNGTLTTDDYALVDTGSASAGSAPASSDRVVLGTGLSKPVHTRLHSHSRPYLPGGTKVRQHTRVAPPELVVSGRA